MKSQDWVPDEDEPESDPDMGLYVFMIVFWPVSMILGLIDYYSIPDHDLQLVNLLLGAAAGWIAVMLYRKRERSRHEAV